jgi:PKD repeat protein
MSGYKKLFVILFLCLLAFTNPCKKGPYVPQEGDIIYLSVTPDTINPGETAVITITGIKANGHSMPDNTLVRITVDIGKLVNEKGETVEAVLLFNGEAQVTYQSDINTSGVIVTVTAQGGSAVIEPEQLTIIIKNIDISQLFITADPSVIPPGENKSQITVAAYNSDMEPVEGKKIFLETTAGTFTPPPPLTTDEKGEVSSELETDSPATVTAIYKEVTKSIDITFGENTPPAADFEFSPQNPFSGDTVYFISTSTDKDGTIEKYQWNFGDGKTSSKENPSHRYRDVDVETTYTVKLTVEDNLGAASSITKPVTISVSDNTAPVAEFSYSPENPTVNEYVQFISESSDEDGFINIYQWDFGDGSETSASQNPRYAYQAAGVYAVTLTVTDNDGKASSITKAITVTGESGETASTSQSITVSPLNKSFCGGSRGAVFSKRAPLAAGGKKNA